MSRLHLSTSMKVPHISRNGSRQLCAMAAVKINAIEIPRAQVPELEKRFAHRAYAVDNQPGSRLPNR